MYIRDYNNDDERKEYSHFPGLGSGLALLIIVLPELFKLHKTRPGLAIAGGIVGFILGTAAHLIIIYFPLSKKYKNERKTLIVSDTISILSFIIACVIIFIRVKSAV